MNVELLQKVKDYILSEPRRFNLDFWGVSVDPKYLDRAIDPDCEEDELGSILRAQRPPCGAVGCIAGNVCILAGIIEPSKEYDKAQVYEFPWDTLELAAEALDIDEDSAKKLFYLREWGHTDSDDDVTGWPVEFETKLGECQKGTAEYAKVAAERIEHFIQTCQ